MDFIVTVVSEECWHCYSVEVKLYMICYTHVNDAVVNIKIIALSNLSAYSKGIPRLCKDLNFDIFTDSFVSKIFCNNMTIMSVKLNMFIPCLVVHFQGHHKNSHIFPVCMCVK